MFAKICPRWTDLRQRSTRSHRQRDAMTATMLRTRARPLAAPHRWLPPLLVLLLFALIWLFCIAVGVMVSPVATLPHTPADAGTGGTDGG